MARIRTRNCNLNRRKPPVVQPTLAQKQHHALSPPSITPTDHRAISFPSSITTVPGLAATPSFLTTITNLPSTTAFSAPAANYVASPCSPSPWPRRFQVPPHPPGTFFVTPPAHTRAAAPSPAYLHKLEKARTLRLRVTVNTSALCPLYKQPVFYRELPNFFSKKPYTLQEVKDVLENDPDFRNICRVVGLRGAEVAFLMVNGVSVSSEDGFSGLLEELWWAYEEGAVGGERRVCMRIVLGRGRVGSDGSVGVGDGGEGQMGGGGVEDEKSEMLGEEFSQVGRIAEGGLEMREELMSVGSMEGGVWSVGGSDGSQETSEMRGVTAVDYGIETKGGWDGEGGWTVKKEAAEWFGEHGCTRLWVRTS